MGRFSAVCLIGMVRPESVWYVEWFGAAKPGAVSPYGRERTGEVCRLVRYGRSRNVCLVRVGAVRLPEGADRRGLSYGMEWNG